MDEVADGPGIREGSDARTISDFIHWSHIVDLSLLFIILSLLSARSAEQLVTGSVHRIQ